MAGDEEASLSKLNKLIKKGSEHEAIDYILKHNITERELLKEIRIDKSISGFSPLALASAEGYLDLVKLLVARGFHFQESAYNDESDELYLPIHFACAAGRVNIVRYFIEEQGFDVNQVERKISSYSLLQTATDGEHLPLVKYLVEAGASINMEEVKPIKPPLQMAASENSRVHFEIIRYLISKGADVNIHYGHGFTPLQKAVECNNFTAARLLLDAGANPNLSDDLDYNPLIMAVQYDSLGKAKLLISHGADVSVKDSDDTTLLQTAVSSINTYMYELVFYLVMADADSLLRNDDSSMIPLKLALEMNNRNAVRLLVNFCDLRSEQQIFQFVQENEQHNDMIEFLHECIPCPRPLKDLCCFRIRCSLASRFPSGVEQLCLPRVVKDYLQLKHLSPELICDI